jgi:hypothetical protein
MITAKMDAKSQARFNAALQKLVALSGEPVEEIMRQQGRLFAVDAARFTNRVGNKASAGRDQKKDVRSTIDLIYINPLNMAKTISKRAGVKDGNRFRNYIRRREASKAQAMIDRLGITRGRSNYRIEVGMFDGGNRHTRWLKGRRGTTLVVMDYRLVTRYKTQKVKNVGALKAGWAKAAEDLGGSRGIPAYAKKGHKARGHGSVRGKGGKVVLRVSNRSRYILQNTSATKLWRLRTKNIEKVAERMIKRKAKQITKKV